MKQRYLEDYGFYPDIITTSCSNSLKIKDVDFRVPCGKCLQCRRKRKSDWSLRLEHEYLHSDSAFFITLTYGEWAVPYAYRKSYQVEQGDKKVQRFKYVKTNKPTLNKKHLQDYIKQLRNSHVSYVSKQLNISKKEVKNVSRPIRYYAVGEYGSKTDRPHYHLLLFNYDIANLAPITDQWKNTKTGFKHGFVQVGTLGGDYGTKSLNYVTKYMFKDWGKKDSRQRPFSMMSKGRKLSKYGIIGFDYLNNYGKYHIESEDLSTADGQGIIRRLPKAYVQRLFEDKEKRLEICQRSYKQHIRKKVDDFHKVLNDHYNGDVVMWQKSKDSDDRRLIFNTINSETL